MNRQYEDPIDDTAFDILPGELTPIERSAQLVEENRAAAAQLVEDIPRAGREAVTRVAWRIAAAVVLLVLAITVTGLFVTYRIATDSAAKIAASSVVQQSLEQQRVTTQASTDAAIEQLQASNDELRARGQAPVAQPPNLTAQEAVVAASTARVLAALPVIPNTSQIGQLIATTVDARLSSAVAAGVANYLRANPPPAGPKGDTGQQGQPGDTGQQGPAGDSPTQEQIQDAVNAYLVANPPPAGPKGDGGEPPFSWTYVDALGGQHTCSRTDPFDPAQPTYACN